MKTKAKKKGKTKGNLKGKLRLGKKKASKFLFYGIEDPKIKKPTNEFTLNVVLGEELLDNIRKIIREELGKPVTLSYKARLLAFLSLDRRSP